MKIKLAIIISLILLLSSCSSSIYTSKFSSEKVELGMSRSDFVKLFGAPFAKEMFTTPDNRKLERLLYREDLFDGLGWYNITTSFTFEGQKLVS